MIKVQATNPVTGEMVSSVFPKSEKDHFLMNQALAKSNAYTYDSNGFKYVVSEKKRHIAQGEIARGKRENAYYNYKNSKKK